LFAVWRELSGECEAWCEAWSEAAEFEAEVENVLLWDAVVAALVIVEAVLSVWDAAEFDGDGVDAGTMMPIVSTVWDLDWELVAVSLASAAVVLWVCCAAWLLAEAADAAEADNCSLKTLRNEARLLFAMLKAGGGGSYLGIWRWAMV
jgi:hypothetical protein